MSARDWTAGSARAITLRSMAALGVVVLGCATRPTRYEIEREVGAICILSTDGIGGIEGESWRQCLEKGSLMLANNPELLPLARNVRQSCTGSAGIAPQTEAMDACLREEILLELNRSQESAKTAQIAKEVFFGLLSAVGRAAASQSQPDYTTYPEVPPLQPPIYCTTMPDGWGGSTTTCR